MRKRMTVIAVITALAILVLGTLTTWINIRGAEVSRSNNIFRQVSAVLEENESELRLEQQEYSATCLENAKAVAYILQLNPSARESVDELQKICAYLEIDEIHIFNEQGVIVQGTQPQYYGYSFDSGEQMAFFRPMLDDKSLELVQDAMPNTAADKMEQYSAVWSDDGTFIVEVGMHPERLDDYVARNELPYVFHMLGAGSDSSFYAVDVNQGIVSAATDESLAGKTLEEVGFTGVQVKGGEDGFFATLNGERSFCVTEQFGDVYIVRSTGTASMMHELLIAVVFLVVALAVLFTTFNVVIMRQIETNVSAPIDSINKKLKLISDGKYETRVEKQGTEEFSEFAGYVNEMAESIEEQVSTVYYQSRHDLLTGAWNRNALQLKLGRLRVQEGTAGILYADLNGLKKINDEQGHDAGDQAIIGAAKALSAIFGKSAVYRAGGDEFVVVDETLSREEFERKVELFNEGWGDDEDSSVSTGMVFCEDTREIDQDMNRADAAMYQMKHEYYRDHLDQGMRIEDKQATLSYQFNEHAEDAKAEQEQNEKPVWLERLEAMFTAFSVVAEDTYVYLTDLEHDYSIWSRSAVDTFGLPDTHMLHAGDLWEARVHPDDRADFHRSIEMIFSGEMDAHDMQYRAREVNGRYDICTCRGIVIRDEAGNPQYFGGSIRNNSLEDHVDSLTGLMNQDGFFDALRSLLRNHQEAVIMTIGISEFSEINSLYGYEFGNRVIQKVARHCSTQFANLGDYFRLDGTQSILISNEAPAEVLERKYDELRSWFFEQVEVDGHHIPLRLNGAIMKLDRFDVDDNTVFVCLNTAFQRSKREQRGELVYFGDLSAEGSQGALAKINAIRLSLSRGFEDFRLEYQPIVDAKTERLAGAEALLRWSNDEFGSVPPNVFIPVLENDTHFHSLGLWILRQAMSDNLETAQRYPGFKLHVNLSYTQVQKPGFAQEVINLIKMTGYPAQGLCLEITERCRLVDNELLENLIARLKAHGVIFALDDFGTGYSSANVLRELDLDVVKVDKSFIADIETDSTAQKALASFIDIAHIYGAETCVEGVETASMRDKLRAFPIDTLQGYFYARPIPVDEFRSNYL